MGRQSISRSLLDIYRRLKRSYGPQDWWPAEGRFEVIVGAILTQSAAWTNVEKAIARLKDAGALTAEALRRLSQAEIGGLIYSAGYYNTKARKLKALADRMEGYDDDLDKLFDRDVESLREELLSIYGIGEETADSIILYAAGKPVFVIDAYTRRIVSRIGLSPVGDGYAAYQRLFMENLPADVRLFNEYHALLVCLGKNFCRKRPLCRQCCLRDICRFEEKGETG